ncbi:hypothetical protein DOE78_18905 [Bacillus sp. Y1]|nr:hypothetical protein [Bacillus sp. Y1]AYA77350.1 hypothetical protein DOE78_18905 [Bacillus sp. Y1]
MNIHEEIMRLHAETKRGDLPRALRLLKIEQLTEDYFAKTGEMPDGVALERLTDLCLYEELTDPHPDKVTRTEYPFMSETQLEERYKAEVSFKVAEEHGVDGRNHKPPLRRKRTKRDEKFIDKHARIRNKERKQKYDEFTKVQPVYIRKIGN